MAAVLDADDVEDTLNKGWVKRHCRAQDGHGNQCGLYENHISPDHVDLKSNKRWRDDGD